MELLIDLQKEPLLSTFNLVGGTALALHLGHRKVFTYFDDIDFNESIVMLYNDFDWDKISNRLIDMTKEPNRIFEKI